MERKTNYEKGKEMFALQTKLIGTICYNTHTYVHYIPANSIMLSVRKIRTYERETTLHYVYKIRSRCVIVGVGVVSTHST